MENWCEIYVWDISRKCHMDVILQPAAVNTVTMSFYKTMDENVWHASHTVSGFSYSLFDVSALIHWRGQVMVHDAPAATCK